jgi:hypothetical protein
MFSRSRTPADVLDDHGEGRPVFRGVPDRGRVDDLAQRAARGRKALWVDGLGAVVDVANALGRFGVVAGGFEQLNGPWGTCSIAIIRSADGGDIWRLFIVLVTN